MSTRRRVLTHILALAFLIGFVLEPARASAQSSPADLPIPVPPAVRTVLESFDKPLHPIVGGVVPSGSWGVGVGYTTPTDKKWFHNGELRYTINQYWLVVGEVGRQTNKSKVGFFGQARNMNQLDFYGLGPNSLESQRSDYALQETAIGLRGWVQPASPLRLGASAQFYVPSLGPGHSGATPSVDATFFPSEVPGLNADPNFGRYRGYIEVSGSEGIIQFAVEADQDLDGGTYDFQRYETEMRQRFPGFRPDQYLTLHGILAATNPDGVVPFYLLYTLGGGGSLGAFRPNTLGGDGTRATIRSFHDYRFRDRNILLAQAEYRIPLRQYVDATVFVDAGRVAPTFSDVFGSLKPGTGFSLSLMHKGTALARMDVGFAGGEGMHVFWNFGGLLN